MCYCWMDRWLPWIESSDNLVLLVRIKHFLVAKYPSTNSLNLSFNTMWCPQNPVFPPSHGSNLWPSTHLPPWCLSGSWAEALPLPVTHRTLNASLVPLTQTFFSWNEILSFSFCSPFVCVPTSLPFSSSSSSSPRFPSLSAPAASILGYGIR